MTPGINQKTHSENCKVVLVEDNKAEADLARIIYRGLSLPVDIIHCQNGEEFLKLLDTARPSDICYVLLDINMPRLNGFDVLKALSKDEKWKNLVVIIFSSSNNAKDVSRCYELGAKAYVVKPFDINELDRIILSIHSFWGDLNNKPVLC